jgi:hypothetical protein
MPNELVRSPQVAATGSTAASQRAAEDIFKEVWSNLSGTRTWGQMIGLLLLLAPTFMPVMALWGSDRLRPDEPLLPLFVAISVIGGILGLPLCYPKKGYWLPGVIAGPLFGPGVFVAFWLLAGAVMNKLIFLLLVVLGGVPSFSLYVLLLCWKARQSDAG